MVAGVKLPGIGRLLRILNDFRELCFCGACGPYFLQKSLKFYLKTFPRIPKLYLEEHLAFVIIIQVRTNFPII